MTEQNGHAAPQRTVTPNEIMMTVQVLPPQVPGAHAGVLIALGYPQQRVETLLDLDTAKALHEGIGQALQHVSAMNSGLILPQQNGHGG